MHLGLGFCVARTNEVLASAKEIKDERKELSVQESCIVDISIGLVSILALSADESLLAATVGSEINFFPVSTLLLKVTVIYFRICNSIFFTCFLKCCVRSNSFLTSIFCLS